jgi:hypothetical protein
VLLPEEYAKLLGINDEKKYFQLLYKSGKQEKVLFTGKIVNIFGFFFWQTEYSK